MGRDPGFRHSASQTRVNAPKAQPGLRRSRSRCRGAKRPGYEGEAERRETRGLASGPRGGCVTTPARLRARHFPVRYQGSASLGAPLRSLCAYRVALACFRRLLAGVVQRAPRARVVSLPVERFPRPPDGRLVRPDARAPHPAPPNGTTGRRPSASRMGWIYGMMEVLSRTKYGQNVAPAQPRSPA